MAVKKLLLAGVTALSVLTASEAMSAEVPKQYLGQWCYIDIQSARAFRRCRESNGEGAPAITRETLYLGEPDSEDEACRVLSVRPIAKGHRVNVTRCGRSYAVDLWLDIRGHLHIEGVTPEVPAQYRGKWCGGDNRAAADIGKDRVDNIPLEEQSAARSVGQKSQRCHQVVKSSRRRCPANVHFSFDCLGLLVYGVIG